MTTDVPQPTVRSADRGAATRAALLAAARGGLYLGGGYAQAGVTEIVARAGASVGSLYHHFTGKADLYVTLFEGVPPGPGLAGAPGGPRCPRGPRQRATAVGSWPRPAPISTAAWRNVSCPGCSSRGDAPPGFDLVMRQRLREWASRNADFFARSAEPMDEAVAVGDDRRPDARVAEVSLDEDAAHARRLAGDVLDVLSAVSPGFRA